MYSMTVSRLKRVRISTIFILVVLSIMTITFLFPLWHMLVNALKTKQEYYKSQFALPSSLNLKQFSTVIKNFKILGFFANTLIVATASTSFLVILTVFAGYAFAKLRFTGKSFVYLAVIATMFLPGQVSMIPAYVMFSKLKLIDSFWSVILSYVAGGLPSSILLATGAISNIPSELIESSKIDGAGYFPTVRHIIWPLSLSSIAIVVIFNFIGYWNDLLTPMLYLSSSHKHTVMVALVSLVQRTTSQPTVQLAGLMLSVLPAIMLYLLLQKYLVKGMLVGSFR